MIKYDNVFSIEPYSLDKNQKKEIFINRLGYLTAHHIKSCRAYKNMLDGICFNADNVNDVADFPFLPVSLFKNLDLCSVDENEVIKTMTSSGTTGQQVSKIFLDKITASNQQRVFVKIVSNFTGASRLPLMIIDTPTVMKDRNLFSARGAGILGFSIFASDKIFCLDEAMNIDIEAIEIFLSKHKDKKILLFGFTFMVWQHFYKAVKEKNLKIDLSNAVLIHGGGWKKLQSEAVSQSEFCHLLKSACGINQIFDYYGMVEQTGCIYMQCEHGHLHASVFSDIIIRNPKDFSVLPDGTPGIIQVLSLIPESYPGHSLLTEDVGIVLGEDNCPCGRLGKYFKVLGRLQNAELRGCSDTYASQF
ncbi:acyl-protein synthetase [Dickeya oryzae]|uniref:LuxE/PaaK family acyltransferase n=1 Tax=Dickeya oryzae TaxID=1240404 RepID=UPI001AECA33A|nr:acyl-protein synthetase [Dickeya oryzae]MBP2848789.1 acyl-protein synthetase [Dickeya oryzae]